MRLILLKHKSTVCNKTRRPKKAQLSTLFVKNRWLTIKVPFSKMSVTLAYNFNSQKIKYYLHYACPE